MQQYILDYFRHFTLIQVIDIALVLLLVFQLYRSLRGSIAYNIFIGSLVIYILWKVVDRLNMVLMGEILDRMASIGLLALLVVFQPEIRKFLINLGRRSPLGKNGFISRMFQSNSLNKYLVEEEVIESIAQSLKYFQEKKLGSILVIARSEKLEFDTNSGCIVNGNVSTKLLSSIFSKSSPLHDGAVLIDRDNLFAAGIILPISDSHELPSSIGLRHRAAVGATEHSDVLVIVVSEETGKISMASHGKLQMNVALEDVKKEIFNVMTV